MADFPRRELPHLGTRASQLLSLEDIDAWSPAVRLIVEPRFRSAIADDWLAGEPDALDTRHHATARVILTNSGVSPVVLGDIPENDLGRSVPMGYTALRIAEKRAVIVDGELARLWPAAFDRAEQQPTWALVIPDDPTGSDGGSPIFVDAGIWGERGANLGHAVLLGNRLSRLMAGRPVLLVRVLSTRGWH